MPDRLVIEMVYASNFWLNCFPPGTNNQSRDLWIPNWAMTVFRIFQIKCLWANSSSSHCFVDSINITIVVIHLHIFSPLYSSYSVYRVIAWTYTPLLRRITRGIVRRKTINGSNCSWSSKTQKASYKNIFNIFTLTIRYRRRLWAQVSSVDTNNQTIASLSWNRKNNKRIIVKLLLS